MNNKARKPHAPVEYMSGHGYVSTAASIVFLITLICQLCNAQTGPTFWVYDGAVALPYPFNPSETAPVTEIESNQFFVDLTSFSSRWFTMESDEELSPPGTNSVPDINYDFWGVTIWGIPSPQTNQYGTPDGAAGRWEVSSYTNDYATDYHMWNFWTNHVQVHYGDMVKILFPDSVTNIATNWPCLMAMEVWTTNSGETFGTNYETAYMSNGWNTVWVKIKDAPRGQAWHQSFAVTNINLTNLDLTIIYSCTNCGKTNFNTFFPPLKLFDTNSPPDLLTNPLVPIQYSTITNGDDYDLYAAQRAQQIKADVDYYNALKWQMNAWQESGIPNATYQIMKSEGLYPGPHTGDDWEVAFTGTYDTNGRGYSTFYVTNSSPTNVLYFFRTRNRYYEP